MTILKSKKQLTTLGYELVDLGVIKDFYVGEWISPTLCDKSKYIKTNIVWYPNNSNISVKLFIKK